MHSAVRRLLPAQVAGLVALALLHGCAVGEPIPRLQEDDGGLDPSLCGNGVTDPGETCDPLLAAPGPDELCDCYDGLPCTTDTAVSGSPSTCDVECNHTAIVGCDIVCGDGQLDPGEECEDGTSDPCDCDDGNPCTENMNLGGSASDCSLRCAWAAIPGCSGVCGDGVLDPGEACEDGTETPCTCDDGNPCTTDSVVSGSPTTCDLVCSHSGAACCAADPPDDSFTDSDCDGIDGTVAQLVFVDGTAGQDANPGTQSSPVRTIGRGIELAAARLAGGEAVQGVAVSIADYDERVVLSSGVGVYGGYNRAMGWVRSAAFTPRIVTTAVQSSGASPFVEGVVASGVHATTVLDRFEVRPTTTGASPAGTSVIGVRIVGSSGVVLRNVYVQSGPGRPGAPGSSGAVGAAGNDGADANGRTRGDGAGDTTCNGAAAAGTRGGRGGTGGADATEGCEVVILNGGEVGQSPSGISGCSGGTPGGGAISDDCSFPPPRDAIAGGPGATCGASASPSELHGAPATSSAAIGSVQSGLWVSSSGNANGAIGKHGPGGSGGGGGGAGDANNCTTGAVGGGGGGGGSGGCGGGPGGGGGGGGASIGLLAVDASLVTIEGATELRGGNGGAGGAGGAGGVGGPGGEGGLGGAGGETDANACEPLNWPTDDPRDGANGGEGGDGHAGGQGGGGQGGPGGPSVGILRCNSTLSGAPLTGQGASGQGGAAGSPNGPSGATPNPTTVVSGCSL